MKRRAKRTYGKRMSPAPYGYSRKTKGKYTKYAFRKMKYKKVY